VKVKDCGACEGCPFRKLFPENELVPPKYGHGLELVVGEAPGQDEVTTHEPFTGGAGRWLDAMLPQAGLKRANLSFVNVINCHPPKNIFPTDSDGRSYISQQDAYEAVSHCRKAHVQPVLEARSWNRVFLLGEKALRFVGEKYDGIGKWRGSPIPIPSLDPSKLLAIPTMHPAAIMRDQTLLPVVINDLRKKLTLTAEKYTLYPDISQVKAFNAKKFAFDIETSYKNHGEVYMCGLSSKVGEALVVPFRGAYVDELKRIFRDATDVVGHNAIQFDLPILRGHGIETTAQVWDTMLMQHLRFPDLPHDLEFVASQFCNKPAWKHDKGVFELYNARDTDVTWQIFEQLKPLVEQHNLLELYKTVQVPLARICKLMTDTGFKVDPANLIKLRADLTVKMAVEETHLPDFLRTRTVVARKRKPAPAGTLSPKTHKPVKFVHEEVEEQIVPWRSSDVVADYLYGKLGLDPVLDVKTGRITSGKMALDKLSRKTGNRALQAIRTLRKYNSLMTLFAKEDMKNAERMHPSFNVHGTASGRLSSSRPNLQNVPDSARFLYVPSEPGWKIIDVDYSQIENRLTAYFAGDDERLKRFQDYPDFSEHKYLASKFLNVPYDEVEKSADAESPYAKAKKIVHGVNYAEGALKISKINDIPFQDVKIIMNMWKDEIRETIQWQGRTASEAAKLGYLANPFGRKRWFYTASKYTESISFLPQSTAADIIFRVMIGLMYERVGWPESLVNKVVQVYEPLPEPARLLLQVHDSLILEAPESLVGEVVRVIKKIMLQPWPELAGFTIPIGVKVGDDWGSAETYK
jgi:DNA polymerase-1